MSFSSPVSESLDVALPGGCNFWHTVRSHGWCALPPFAYEVEGRLLRRVFFLDNSQTASCELRGAEGTVRVRAESHAGLTGKSRTDLIRQIRTCLRLDEDFSEFHREARRHAQYRWIAQRGAGRMLRAPTVFEDAIKMICTTNCTWALTTMMVSNLVLAAGTRHAAELYAFPSAESVASLSEATLRREVKAGYRSAYLLELAQRVAAGTLEIESWRRSPVPTRELFAQMRSVKGIGPYAAGNLLKLVGRYDYLGLDSWVRARYSELHHRGRRVKDATIERAYAPYGQWRGLFFWLEMTRSWHDDKFRL